MDGQGMSQLLCHSYYVIHGYCDRGLDVIVSMDEMGFVMETVSS